MYILGYSGLNGYLKYKKDHISGLTLNESYVSQGMDAAASIIKNGKIIAACAEERFTGQKHTGTFPVNAIKACLEIANITLKDIDMVAHNFNYEQYEQLYSLGDYTKGLFEEVLSVQSQIELFRQHFGVDVSSYFSSHNHHDTHATYAYETSGFTDSLVIVADGLGEFMSISIYNASREGVNLLKAYGPESSLGMLYSAVTDYLGFITNSDEYKIMGMAAYGDPSVYKQLFEDIVVLNDEGFIKINNLIPNTITSPEDRETYRHFKVWLSGRVFPERQPDEPIEQKHKDLTAALQHRLNEAMLHIVSYWKENTGQSNLCMSGGVALNCVTNSRIAESKLFQDLYIAPAAADDGTSLGAALITMKEQGIQLDKRHYMDMPFYGPEITLSLQNPLISENNLIVKKVKDGVLLQTVAKAVLENKIIAWTQGRMEFGPRALGNRSILANPRDYAMRDRLNVVTKQRESFRPFAPMVKEEVVSRYFKINTGVVYKHMLVNAEVLSGYRDKLQAVTHQDNTARVQSVSKRDLPLIWGILDLIEKQCGIPVLLNTSYNLKSMPIVCYEDDALKSFIDSDIDLLIINNYIVSKE